MEVKYKNFAFYNLLPFHQNFVGIAFLSSLFDLAFMSMSASNLQLHLHDIFIVNVFVSFIPVILLNTLRFKSSVLFGKHISY